MLTSDIKHKELFIKFGRKKLFFLVPFLVILSLAISYRAHQTSSYKARVALRIEEPTDMDPSDNRILSMAAANVGLAGERAFSAAVLKNRLSVTGDGASGVIEISMTAPQPKGLVSLINEIADVYAYEVAKKSRQVRLGLIKKREPEIREYRNNLERELKRARQRLEECEIEMERFKEGDERILNASDSLRSRLAELEAERSGLLRIYTDLHPDVVRLNADIAGLKRELSSLPPRPTGGFELERNLEDSQRHYAAIKKGWDEMRSKKLEDGAGISEKKAVTVTSYAKKAQPLFDPKTRSFVLIMGITLSLAVGLVSVLLAVMLDTSILNPEELSAYTHLPVVAALPFVRPGAASKNRPRGGADGFLLNYADESGIIEPYRMLYTNLQHDILSEGPDCKSILITSSVPREGKTVIASNLALVMARAGKRVMLIDCNLSRPSVFKLFGIGAGRPGLTDVLNGSAPLDSAVMNITDMVLGKMEMDRALQVRGLDRLSVMTSGSPLAVAGELLRSDKIDALMAGLRAKFDLLVLDGPSAASSADSLILSLKCQVTFLVYSAGEPATHKGSIRSAIAHLKAPRGKVPAHVIAGDGSAGSGALRGVIMSKCT